MMKARTSFLKRCLALALALVLLVSGTNMGVVLQAFAAENEDVTVHYGVIVANNYDLTAAEKDLLKSGYLAGGDFTYSKFDEKGLVGVDFDARKITAENYKGWVPTNAHIVVGEEIVETVGVVDGVATYTYTGKAFSVKVDYVLNTEFSEEVQQTMLATAGWLKAGVANVDALYAKNNALTTLQSEQAMEKLVDIADNGYSMNGMTLKPQPAVIDAIHNLDSQLKANGGDMNLVAMLKEYNKSKVGYLLQNGNALKAEIESTKADVYQVHGFLGLLNTFASQPGIQLGGGIAELIDLVYNMLGEWLTVADATINGSWTAAEKGTALVKSGITAAEYKAMDALVAALGSTSVPTTKKVLHVADASAKVNMNMVDVSVVVVLKVVEDKNDSAELTEYGKTDVVTLTLSQNATKAEILAAVEEAGIEAGAKAKWAGVYHEDHFGTLTTELPDVLVENVEYTITYVPRVYDVTLNYHPNTMTVPYGYKYTLPRHENAEQAYDYKVNGNKMAQGSVYTIVGDTDISRSAGKAYNTTDLYTLIADNYGNQLASEILKSGALKNNVTINIRKPDPADSESMIKLEGGKLTVDGEYAADYEGQVWVPYSYGEKGTEKKFGVDETEVNWSKSSVKVQYVLTLKNFTKADVDAVQKLIADLKFESDDQIATLNRLAAKYDQMGQLNSTVLGAMDGMISNAKDLNKDPAKNAALQKTFGAMVKGILENNMDGDYLRIYTMLGKYQDKTSGGLTYYYGHSAEVIAEIDALSTYLSGLVKDDDQLTAQEKLDALATMLGKLNYGEYVDKITDLETIVSEVKAALTAPNAAINLNSPNLYKLIAALEIKDTVAFSGSGSPFLFSDYLSALDDTQVQVQVIVDVNGNTATYQTPAKPRGYVLNQADANVLIDEVEAFAEQQLGAKTAFYKAEGFDKLAELVGTELTNKLTNVYITYAPITYTISIEGAGDKDVTIETPQITLAGHGTKGWIYTYDVFGDPVEVAFGETKTYTLTADSFKKIAAGNTTITRTETNKAQEDLEDVVGQMKTIELVKDADGNIIGVNASIEATMGDLTGFAMELVQLGYSYIKLGDGVLLQNGTVSLQALVDAILNDNSFGSQTLIDLGNNNGGQVFSGTMALGSGENDIMFSNVKFTLNLKSAPGTLKTVAEGLEKAKPYMTFKSQDGVMSVNVTMPEKAYEAYLTAMLGTGVVDKTDINALNDEIAYQYLYDYIDLIINTDATTTSYTNTLKKLGQAYDLTGAEKYYQMVKKGLTKEGVKINPAKGDGNFEMSVSAEGHSAINGLLGLIGMDLSGDIGTYLGMVKEYKTGEMLSFGAVATLGNTPSSYEALVLDLNASGTLEKFDYTDNLPARAKKIANQAAVILLGDINGNLQFTGRTILDLNGFTVNGNVSSKGELYIIDSSMATASEGGVTGNVSATAIFGGTYTDTTGAAAALKDGYKLENGVVQNALFSVVKSNARAAGETYTYMVDTDFMAEEIGSYTTFAKALAIDVAVDLVLNYFTAAALSVDSNTIYAINFDQLITLLSGDSKVDNLITKTLACINAKGITDVSNKILADLLNFAEIEKALNNGTAVGTYALSTAPWAVKVDYVATGDYIDIGVGASDDANLAKNFNIAIAFTGKHTEPVAKLAGELAKIADVKALVNLEQPTYANKKITVGGGAYVAADIDMSANNNYATMIGVILAYGNTAKRQAVKDAINHNNLNGLKTVVDNTTVAEFVTALKALSVDVNFAKMATTVGVTVDVTAAAELESAYHLILCANGKALKELKVTGNNSKFGSLYNKSTGYYELEKEDIFKDVNVSSVHADLEITKVSLKVKIFGQVDCLWGDVNHDDIVDINDATYLMQYLIDLNPSEFKCALRADVDGQNGVDINDATYILMYLIGTIPELPFYN